MKNILASLLLFVFLSASAQEEDWKSLLAQGDSAKHEKTRATFKTTRIINAQSVETVKAKTLDFRISHRFGIMGNGAHTLYGFDVSSDIRLAFEYGINDKLTLGIARCKRKENIQALVKYRVLQQTPDNHMPVSLTWYSDMTFTPEKDIDGNYDAALYSPYNAFAHRMTYVHQAIIARKFSPGISLELLPTVVHRNFVKDPGDENTLFALGAGGRFKLSRRSAIIFDYFHAFSAFRKNNTTTLYSPPLGLGWEVETGGHVFSIMFSNSAGLAESDFITSTTDSWLDGGFRFSFNISRGFLLR